VKPQEAVERALAAAGGDDCVVLADEVSSANLRWAGNTLTTNGVARSRTLTVIALRGGPGEVRAGVVSRSALREDQIADVVAQARGAAAEATPADDAQPLLRPGDPAAASVPGGSGGAGWDEPAAGTRIGVFGEFAGALGEAFGAAAAGERLLYGFAEHTMTTTFLGTSTGLRLRHDQPTGTVQLTAKSADLTRSAWASAASSDFADVDVPAMEADLARRLGWAARRVELPAGRYETLLPPSAVADLMIYLYWSAGARDAAEGRTVFSGPGGGTRVGDQLASVPLTLSSDPALPGVSCAPFVAAHASSRRSSAFDNGLALGRTEWISAGRLAALIQTRHSARLTGLPVTPAIGNLALDVPGASASLPELVAGTRRGLLLTSLFYIREVDPQRLLLTGLTRDGVYLVENGEVTGAVNNFRFNESPVALLGRIAEAGASGPALSREWGDYFSRTLMPPLRVADFTMSSVSQAS
jgi:predicted Zn-dependent protease